MKSLRKIIALFASIFIIGIVVTVLTVKSSLKNTSTEQETVEMTKDTTYLLKAEEKNKRV